MSNKCQLKYQNCQQNDSSLLLSAKQVPPILEVVLLDWPYLVLHYAVSIVHTHAKCRQGSSHHELHLLHVAMYDYGILEMSCSVQTSAILTNLETLD